MGYNAITISAPHRKKMFVTLEIRIGIPFFVDGYPKDREIIMSTNALIDTGATGSCISRNFAQNAQFRPFMMGQVRGAHGIATVPVYIVDVLLPNGILFPNMEVTEFYGAENFDFIIGMNILCMGDMALSNAKNQTVFSFRMPPAETHIDFTQPMPSY